MHLSFESVTIIGTLGVQKSFLNIHHNTSLMSILEDNFISSTFKTRIHSCSSKGVGLWLVVKPSIRSFHITHSIFILVLHFHINLIQPSASNFFTCEHGHMLDASSTLNLLPIWRLVDSHTWCHSRCHLCPCSRKWTHCLEKTIIHLYM
jgi:hypothetical protein